MSDTNDFLDGLEEGVEALEDAMEENAEQDENLIYDEEGNLQGQRTIETAFTPSVLLFSHAPVKANTEPLQVDLDWVNNGK